MTPSSNKRLGPGRVAKATSRLRRLWPFLLMAWERWQSLSDEEKERYKRQAREYAQRGKQALEQQRRKRGS